MYNELISQYPTDKRTSGGQERLVLEKIASDGGYTIFWVTENQKRAWAATRLLDSGVIKVTGGSFPWNIVEIMYV